MDSLILRFGDYINIAVGDISNIKILGLSDTFSC